MEKKIENTEKNPRPEWTMGGNPDAVERQETEGQAQLVTSSQLPANMSPRSGLSAPKHYALMGITVIGPTKGDELFLDVVLPGGWDLMPTEHSMWSHLIDDKGRQRGSIFYKAAFYDRDAFMSLKKRFNFEVKYHPDEEIKKKYSETYEQKNHAPIYGIIRDGDKVIFETEKEFYTEKYLPEYKDLSSDPEGGHRKWWNGYQEMQDKKEEECKAFLDEHYPGWDNYHAYWD